MSKGRQHMHFTAWFGQTRISKARPQNRVHFCHVSAPEHEYVCVFQIIVTTHWLVDAETAHECANCRSHTMASIWVEAVGAETRFNQF